jgi:riboflavin kinase/FMN adenylyltransferase
MTLPQDMPNRQRPFLAVDGDRPLPPELSGAVAAIGNFDGLHLGHRAVIEQAEAMARPAGRPAVLLTFEPHPRAFFRPQEPVFRLTPLPLKLAIARRLGLDGAIVMAFGPALAATGAADFVGDVLAGRLGLAGVAVGHDFHFGRGREGSPSFIAERGAALGLDVSVVLPLQVAGHAVSSSAVRAALAAGDVEEAARLLGYRWIARAEVVHGDKRGRTLGYPTANMQLDAACGLKHGIYAVRVSLDGTVHDAVASYGRRPTFDDGAPLLEVFLFGFTGDLYGRVLDVEFCARIRGEEKFDSVEALIARMDQDSREARAALSRGDVVPAPSLLPLPEVELPPRAASV